MFNDTCVASAATKCSIQNVDIKRIVAINPQDTVEYFSNFKFDITSLQIFILVNNNKIISKCRTVLIKKEFY